MGKPGLRKVHRYSVEFKVTAVKLSHMAGVEVQTVADALDIHPFMLSRWRKEVREGLLKGRARRVDVPSRPARELQQLQKLKREHAVLKEEHELSKKRSWAAAAHPTPPDETGLSSARRRHADMSRSFGIANPEKN